MSTAKALGHEYCALTDHSPRLRVANGLSADRLRTQLAVIDGMREQMAPMRILTGIEVDILDDGDLDQDPELLEQLDIVVASVHSKLAMDADAMTRRMIAAVTNPRVDVLGHCTGRLVEGNAAPAASRNSMPQRYSGPAVIPEPPSRSTRDQNAGTRRGGCSTWR